jgi:hypothetical protein
MSSNFNLRLNLNNNDHYINKPSFNITTDNNNNNNNNNNKLNTMFSPSGVDEVVTPYIESSINADLCINRYIGLSTSNTNIPMSNKIGNKISNKNIIQSPASRLSSSSIKKRHQTASNLEAMAYSYYQPILSNNIPMRHTHSEGDKYVGADRSIERDRVVTSEFPKPRGFQSLVLSNYQSNSQSNSQSSLQSNPLSNYDAALALITIRYLSI